VDVFSDRLLEWYARYGRHDLPWQRQRNAYRIWVAEIMLQQTQVATVIPYYERFMARFPELSALAAAEDNEVLHLWSGLGYYARARHLHRAARCVVEDFNGALPRDIDHLMSLPGIGRSTAAAILAMAFGDRHPILDGNVKRVLARFHMVDGWPGAAKVQDRLWKLADRHTPETNVRDYTQAIMDLGATLCTRARPDCGCCPLRDDCRARRACKTADYPAARPRKKLPVRDTRFLIAQRTDGAVLLERRPPTGVWGGLWGFPELAEDQDPGLWCGNQGFVPVGPCAMLEVMDHKFTHFHLRITPLHVQVAPQYDKIMESDMRLWYQPRDPVRIGLAKPVACLLRSLKSS
jgi:A/G-specific adenine glycosylase